MASDLGYISDSSSGEYLEIGELEDFLPRQTEIEPDTQVTEEIDIPPSTESEKTEAHKATSLHARAYQLEMLEESLKQNIIVAMDTGSGKTQVAVLRIQAELERTPPGKVIWFLAPTIPLCQQQYDTIRSQIPSAQVKVLTGNDNVDAWSDPSIWNAFLQNVNVVVSTYQVLVDAVYHAFVNLSNLTLLIFDEAHNCAGNSPGAKLMVRYRDYKGSGRPVPFVLGLTASPVVGSDLSALEKLEQTLDAVCKTPSLHRTELLSMVNRPVLSILPFDTQSPSGRVTPTPLMLSLHGVYHGLDIRQDPFILRKKAENTERSRIELSNALDKHDTYAFRQMKSFCRRSEEICRELGPYAADYFIKTSMTQFIGSVQTNKILYSSWQFNEKHHLSLALGTVDMQLSSSESTNVSRKLQALIDLLLSCGPDTLGIIFVKETGTVNVLLHMISEHPLVGSRFRVGVMVGTSRYAGRRRDIGELNQEASLTLDKFRSGNLDLLIATNVLEEGIDVPACNLVICFDQPTHLKSFIQRRGRARMRESKLVILVEGGTEKHTEWQELEESMKRKYEDEQRSLTELDALEHVEEAYVAPFCIPVTGAQLDFDQGKPHLEHFCAIMGSHQYIDTRPYYIREETVLPQGPPQIRATVVLPPILPPELRRIRSANVWISESNAFKDAAFQAYVALYKAKLVNDYLMPLRDHELLRGVEPRASIIEVNEQWSPWPDSAGLWSNSSEAFCHSLKIKGPEDEILNEFDVILPVQLPNIENFDLYWDVNPWKVEIGKSGRIDRSDIDYDQTTALIKLAYGHRLKKREFGQHVVQFRSKQGSVSVKDIGPHQFTQEMSNSANSRFPFLVRIAVNDAPYFYDQYLPSRPSEDLVKERNKFELKDFTGDEPWLALRKWPRRRDFLHMIPANPDPGSAVSVKPYGSAWPLSFCKVDSTPISNVQFGSLIPSITHMLEIYLVAQRLCDTRLKSLQISDISMVVTAISSPEAREATRYERYEFMGDSLLKLLAAVNVMAHHPYYPEGYLSKKKDLIVSNSRLYRSAIENELDKYILVKPFTGKKWQPQCVEDLVSVEESSGKRMISTKTLADVVEALIWVSHEDGLKNGGKNGGISKALECIRLFVKEIGWLDLEASRLELCKQIPVNPVALPPFLEPLERLIDHKFVNKSLLIAAVTHASYCVGASAETSMERLEFLGDAILDYVVVTELWKHDLSEQEMHLLRTGSVNADLLGFIAMEWTVDRKESKLVDDVPVEVTVQEPFWKFMRFASREIALLQNAVEERHREQRDGIRKAIDTAPTYPWTRLAHLGTPKFFSDMFESVMGAIWLDTGNMDDCCRLAERAGIRPYLKRLIRDNVDVLHPKNQLGQIAGDKKVRYRVHMDPDAGPLPYSCKVYVGDRLLVDVAGGFKKEEVQTKAAEMAYLLLKEHGLGYLEGCPLQGENDGVDDVMKDV